MSIPKTYDPKSTEEKWYRFWTEHKFFRSVPDPAREPYTVVIPPPNVTGILHMGHMLNNTIQDVLVRKARMEGKNACWVPGTDHASIATEAKVVAMLRERGIEKKKIGREKFLEYAWEWKEKYGGIILEQLKKLGVSCDWDRTRFTMEADLYDAVIKCFVELYNRGFIYKGARMVNWDPQARTVLSDEEVIHKEADSELYYVNYPFRDHPEQYITIATTRPETIFGDTAVCVHPDDARYKAFVGKTVVLPVVGREIPVIADEYIDREFGTGCLKVTPAHDINDYMLGEKHGLEVINVFNEDATLNEYGGAFAGKDRFAVRKEFAALLREKGYLVKSEKIKNKVGTSERTGAVVEPLISSQWFMKMSEAAKPALESVLNDEIALIPDKFKNTYRHWMENIRDWCISRQLWWGHRIPAWYYGTGAEDFVVAETEERAVEAARLKTNNSQLTAADLRRDEDVLDTWFSAWLWPISVFDGFKDPDNADIKYYYPTNDLVTAPEILFFWVARMIMAGYLFRGDKPFRNVYLTGIVRDKLGRKMSKSLGNSPDPLELMDKYGADGVRAGMLFSSPAGNDLPFDEKLCEQGRNFCNKVWNALRLVKSWEEAVNLPYHETANDIPDNETAVRWFEAALNESIGSILDHFSKYRISDALMTVYKLIWDDFCSKYLEAVKPEFGRVIDRPTLEKTIGFFETLMKLLHPFMPFITEEIWHRLRNREGKDCICMAKFPTFEQQKENKSILTEADRAFSAVSELRNLRNKKGISPKISLVVAVKTSEPGIYENFRKIILKMAGVFALTFSDIKPENSTVVPLGRDELFVVLPQKAESGLEREHLLKELEYARGFLESVNKKLSNERFVQNAPEQVLLLEKRKKEDAENKIRILEESLTNLP